MVGMKHGGNSVADFLCNEVKATCCEWQINKAERAWVPDGDGTAIPAQNSKWERKKSLVLFRNYYLGL